MQYKYSAKIYLGEKVVLQAAGDDIAHLYVWMLANSNKNLGYVHGEIIDNQTNEIVQTYKSDEVS